MTPIFMKKKQRQPAILADTLAVPMPTAVRGGSGLISHASIREWLVDAAYIMAGCVVFVVGMNALLIHHQMLAGGLTGVALLLHYAVGLCDVGWWYFLLNIPLVWLGWRHIGKRFMILTAFGMTFFSLASVWINPAPFAVHDPILVAISAGAICGLGAGLILRSQGSAGGLDILSVYLKNKWGFSIGSLGFAMNGAILAAGAWFTELQAALYSAIFIFVCARVVDVVMAGVNPQKIVLVISDRSEEVARRLMQQMSCGVTFIQGEGGFSRRDKKIILSVVRSMDVPRFKACAVGEDPEALLVVNAIGEFTGQQTFAGISRSVNTPKGIAQ